MSSTEEPKFLVLEYMLISRYFCALVYEVYRHIILGNSQFHVRVYLVYGAYRYMVYRNFLFHNQGREFHTSYIIT